MATTALSGIVAAGVSGSLSPVIGVPAAIVAAMTIGLLNGPIVVRFRVNGFLATLVMAGAVRGWITSWAAATAASPSPTTSWDTCSPPRSARSPSSSGWSSSSRSVAHSSCAGRGSAGPSWPSVAAGCGSPGWPRSIQDDHDRLPHLGAARCRWHRLASRLGAGIPAAAANQELSLFGAVLIAGTSLWGGRANVVGSIVAILLLQIVYTGLVLSGYPERSSRSWRASSSSRRCGTSRATRSILQRSAYDGPNLPIRVLRWAPAHGGTATSGPSTSA